VPDRAAWYLTRRSGAREACYECLLFRQALTTPIEIPPSLAWCRWLWSRVGLLGAGKSAKLKKKPRSFSASEEASAEGGVSGEPLSHGEQA
jgi:hypothetical protein